MVLWRDCGSRNPCFPCEYTTAIVSAFLEHQESTASAAGPGGLPDTEKDQLYPCIRPCVRDWLNVKSDPGVKAAVHRRLKSQQEGNWRVMDKLLKMA